MKTPWLGLAFVLLSAPMQAQSNEGCDVLKIAGARLVATTAEDAMTQRQTRSFGPEDQKKIAKNNKLLAAPFDQLKPLARDITSDELAKLQPDLRQVIVVETGTFSFEGKHRWRGTREDT